MKYPSLYLIIVMSVLERMRLFFRFCQAVGFFPFRMEIDKQSKQFKEFTFSWRYPITWWFSALTLIQLITSYFTISPVLQDQELNKLPSTLNVSMSISGVIFFLVVLSSRFWITLRFYTLQNALRWMQQVEQNIEEHPDCRCTIKIRTIVGFICIFLWVFRTSRLSSFNSQSVDLK